MGIFQYDEDTDSLNSLAGSVDNAILGQGYGICGTAESTTAKTVALSGYNLKVGGVTAIRFTNAVPANSTLNINSKGAKPIYYKGSALPSDIIRAGDTATFFYDGSYYHLTAVDRQMEFNFATHAAMNAAITAGTVPNGAICHTDKTDYEVVGGVAKPIIKHGQNLLDNWYFVGGGSQQGGGQFPINQRNGYVVPPGTNYRLSGQSEVAGVTSDYFNATINSGGYAEFYINNTLYIAENIVPGYVGGGYGIDRWELQNSFCKIILLDDGIKISSTQESTDTGFFQKIEKRFAEDTIVTASVLYKGFARIVYWGENARNGVAKSSEDWDLLSYTYTIPAGTSLSNNHFPWFGFVDSDNIDYTIFKAAKLELGTKQTLAHQDTNGNWVLNDPPPNYQQELAKCQRYQQVIDCKEWTPIGVGVYYNEHLYSVYTPTPVTLRTIPTITMPSKIRFAKSTGSFVDYTVANVAGIQLSPSGVIYDVYPSNTPVPDAYLVRGIENTGKVILDANL